LIPRIAAGGATFVRAGGYYLGPGKLKDGIAEYVLGSGSIDRSLVAVNSSNIAGLPYDKRVGFTKTLNCSTENAHEAFHLMQQRYETYLGFRKGKRGKTLTLPVYSYSLSWSPEEKPSQKEMMRAAEETLEKLNVEKHQAVIVQHNDKPHPHIHVVVNRVHPTEFKAAQTSKDYINLSRWALEYEELHGGVRCQNRARQSEKRQKKLWHNYMKPRRSEVDIEKQAALDCPPPELQRVTTAEKSKQSKFEEEEVRLKLDLKNRNEQDRIANANFFKPRWKKHFLLSKAMNAEFKAIKKDLFKRACFVFKYVAQLMSVGKWSKEIMFRVILSSTKLKQRLKWYIRSLASRLSREQDEAYRPKAQINQQEHVSALKQFYFEMFPPNLRVVICQHGVDTTRSLNDHSKSSADRTQYINLFDYITQQSDRFSEFSQDLATIGMSNSNCCIEGLAVFPKAMNLIESTFPQRELVVDIYAVQPAVSRQNLVAMITDPSNDSLPDHISAYEGIKDAIEDILALNPKVVRLLNESGEIQKEFTEATTSSFDAIISAYKSCLQQKISNERFQEYNDEWKRIIRAAQEKGMAQKYIDFFEKVRAASTDEMRAIKGLVFKSSWPSGPTM
jgi:hypothetical protein